MYKQEVCQVLFSEGLEVRNEKLSYCNRKNYASEIFFSRGEVQFAELCTFLDRRKRVYNFRQSSERELYNFLYARYNFNAPFNNFNVFDKIISNFL